MDDRVSQRLASQVAQGRLILFTGAGFSMDATSADGRQLPGGGDLTTELWDVAFPGEAYDESSLQDVYEAAIMQRRNDTVSLVRERLSVEPNTLPDHYRQWLSLPWHAVYTLNVDDLAEAANRAFDLPRPLVPVSALTDTLRLPDGGLPVIHLNGRLAELPEVTFTGRQYAERLAAADLWYANLARELASHPFYIGTSLDEPPLWQYVEARGARQSGGRELRPGSYLVTKSLKRARAVALRLYNIDWVEGTARSVADEVLASLDTAAADGFRVLSRSAAREQQAFEELPSIQDDSVGDEREFLLGREPRWSDVTSGFAVERDIDRSLLDVVDREAPRLLVVTGTAGSGKSTSVMRLALVLSGRGKNVVRLNHGADLRPTESEGRSKLPGQMSSSSTTSIASAIGPKRRSRMFSTVQTARWSSLRCAAVDMRASPSAGWSPRGRMPRGGRATTRGWRHRRPSRCPRSRESARRVEGPTAHSALRHRVVAERTVEYFRAERLVAEPLRGLVFAMAAAARPGQLRDSAQGRGVIRLINHKLLIEFLQRPDGEGPDVVAIRSVYDEIESVLGHDHHFLLQRGSFETEEGNLDLAKNFVEQARALAPADPLVRTQWAYMTLKRASRRPEDPGARDQVDLAFGELDEAIAQRGRNDPYPFHIYGSQGLAWANRAPLGDDERKLLLQTMRRVVAEGVDLHLGRRDLRQLAKDLEAEYLGLAVPGRR